MEPKLDTRELNARGWDERVAARDIWTRPIDDDAVARARSGDWSVALTPSKPVPREWLSSIEGARVLCLACGGGQQGPILAAAGAHVTVLDASAAQLGQDRAVADRHALDLRIVQGFMDDLSVFTDGSFDLIFHPVSNCFASEIEPVWAECARVLEPRGRLLAGFMNPIVYIFDASAEARGELRVRFPLPYADTKDLSGDELQQCIAENRTVEFSHSFDAQLGGQMRAGFALSGFYEDTQAGRSSSKYFPAAFATLATRRAAL
ncbi:MAG TPA: class I SAM-dependent methyltransferase [Polyangiaceae bacterium]|nr:class I SAM-dependent methyltransferase [Polyangiaceae bacterium]